MKVFSVRLDQETARKLAMLANETIRTRSSVVRWLIFNAAKEYEPIQPNTPDPTISIHKEDTS